MRQKTFQSPSAQHFPRFSYENFKHNRKSLDIHVRIAERKRTTSAQITISWILNVGDHIIPIPGSITVNGVNENMAAADLESTKDEVEELNRFADEEEARGERYGGNKYNFCGAD